MVQLDNQLARPEPHKFPNDDDVGDLSRAVIVDD
jgi:hypothetical protein